ncbi:MAG TPA: hypothetical protein VNG04_02040, partial [Candidatus Acidoferrum sp.]|nr:hypothetical protein [Candidatus Acidoferrum sp.]
DPSPGFSALAATQFPSHWAAGGIARLIPHLEIGAPLAAIGSLGVLGAIPPAVAIALLVVFAYAFLRRRIWPPRRARAGRFNQETELLRLYERVQRKLGRRRAPPETPLEYLEKSGPEPRAPLLEEVTAAVNQGVYAGRWPDLKSVRELSDRLS